MLRPFLALPLGFQQMNIHICVPKYVQIQRIGDRPDALHKIFHLTFFFCWSYRSFIIMYFSINFGEIHPIHLSHPGVGLRQLEKYRP